MVGQSNAFKFIVDLIGKIAAYDAPVLIEGETGTGKELAARAIHYRGHRGQQPFVPVNCGSIPESLIENELFGHRRGAFTDARENRPGLIALAQSGTLFLDEVDALSPKGQVTLLRFLQDQQYRPLGGTAQQQADVRIIAASNGNLAERVEARSFRMDLFYRLKIMHVVLPPLRDRKGDAAMLAGYFVRAASERFDKPEKRFDAATLAWFDRYLWPGNIRELENLVYREFLLCEDEEIRVAAPPGLSPSSDAGSDDPAEPLNYRSAKARAIAQFESRFLAKVMEMTQGNISAAARIVGTERRHLGRLLKRHQFGDRYQTN